MCLLPALRLVAVPQPRRLCREPATAGLQEEALPSGGAVAP